MSAGEEQKTRNPLVTFAAMGFVVLIVICIGIAVWLRTSGDDSPTSSQPIATETAHPTSGPKPGSSGDSANEGLGTPTIDRLGRRVDVPKWIGGWALPQESIERGPFNRAVAVDPPAGMMWQKVNDGAIVPFSTSDGPIAVDGLTAIGFAHTPQDAALAAWQIVSRIAATNNETAQGIYDRQVVMTADQRAQVNKDLAAQGPSYRGLSSTALSYMTQADAFRIRDYADDFAIIEFATPAEKADASTPQWMTTRLLTTWEGGDWKLRFPETLADPTGSTTDLSGWTQW